MSLDRTSLCIVDRTIIPKSGFVKVQFAPAGDPNPVFEGRGGKKSKVLLRDFIGPELAAKVTVRSEPLCSFRHLGMAAVAREGKQLDARNVLWCDGAPRMVLLR